MTNNTFPFTTTTLRSLRLEQEFQDWEDARQALAHRRAMSRAPLPRAPRLQRQRLQEVRAPPPQARCRDPAIHNTFMCGDMKGVYAVLKDPAMVNALMETVHEEMVWAPEMGMWTMSSTVKQTSALRLAAGRGHAACVEELLFRGAEVNDDPGGSTALHDACAGAHGVCVQVLLSHGADPQVLAEDGSAPLHLCTSPLSFQCAELLLDGGAEVNVRARESRLTPLHVAALRGLDEHVELLLARGADVLATNREGETPLNAACSRAERPSEAGRYRRVVQSLLDAGADPQTAGKKLHTPLHNACANCCPRIVELLLQHGAKADVSNCAGYTPMDCVLQVVEDYVDQHPEAVVRILLNHGAKPVPTKMLRLCVLSAATLEVILNSYPSVPPCDWMDNCVSQEIYQVTPSSVLMATSLSSLRGLLTPPLGTFSQGHPGFFDLMRQRSGQPRSLQHLCRCALRRHFGALCHSKVSGLDIPCCLKDYLLLRNDGTLH
ncbi:ankyrin repeat and SOCS box protein 16 isoform X2 [Dunckerocampus dactyliophorus]|nr:ankyrin repeat and SOCS box protein 16 isoform X2 [Dunckerocampus dactyliophorus]XP_054616073.1 ankyrin repeat and SOCS box protein 16 isoform X2 [Dunckerocampus dactyliophorus]